MCIDLHLHSHYSDGTNSPAHLVQMAQDLQLDAIALTDHDTLQGIDEFLQEARKLDLPAISGIEISTKHADHSLHILGYGINHHDDTFTNWLRRLQEGRESRNEEIINNLQRLGLDIRHDELGEFSNCGQTGRPHIAMLMVKKGLTSSREDAFRLYLRKGAAAWAGRFSYSAEETIAMIHQAGGIAVLAHPSQITPQPKSLKTFIADLTSHGLDGLEGYYPGYKPNMINTLKKIANGHKLVITGGSDYHGDNKQHSRMAGKKSGFCPPTGLLDRFGEKIDAGPLRNI